MNKLAPITIDESRRLIELEGIVSRGKQSFLEVGWALAEIRDSRLYRSDFANFDDYTFAKFGFKKSQAYRLIEAAESFKSSPAGDTVSPVGDTPKNEHQARKLIAERKAKAKSQSAPAAVSEPATVDVESEPAYETTEPRPVKDSMTTGLPESIRYAAQVEELTDECCASGTTEQLIRLRSALSECLDKTKREEFRRDNQ